MFSQAEENYLKTIYRLQAEYGTVNTNLIAGKMQIKASSVTDMIKKLSAKELLTYQKYQGVSLTGEGTRIALKIIRKHRLWEYFLVEKLHFPWDEVHEIAEQLEHVKSEALIDSLDDYLGNPKFDPHGDPIPDKNSLMESRSHLRLFEMQSGDSGILKAVGDSSDVFLRYLNRKNVAIGDTITVLEKEDFDKSILVQIHGKPVHITEKAAANLLLIPTKK